MRANEFITEDNNLIAQVRSELGITGSNNDSYGKCDLASILLWKKMGQPKDFWPTSVMVGEEEHVVLLNKKTGMLYDPTGDQFDAEVGLVHWDNNIYSDPAKLTPNEIGFIEQDLVSGLNGLITEDVMLKVTAPQSADQLL